MYLKHFELDTKPFQITSDPKFLWLGEKHKEALATLRYGILDNRGFLLMTGEVGTGKTILINRLITMLDLDTVVATLPDPDLLSMDFYNLLADGFNMERGFKTKAEFLIQLREFLYRSHAEKKQVLLIIDESQRLNHHLMEDIRVLSNIELHDRKLINIFFVGQQEFNTILAAPQNRALAQRITVRYHIDPLAQNEVGKYIEHRLKVAGTNKKVFSSDAVEEVYRFSGGVPRLINILCDHALLTSYARGEKKVDRSIITECAEELRIPVKNKIDSKQLSSKAPDSKSIADAAARTAAISEIRTDSGSKGTTTGHLTNSKDADKEETNHGSPFVKLLYAVVISVLVVAVGYAITQITRSENPTWDAEDLTPQKYKTSLEKEKELLSKRLEETKQDQEQKNEESVDPAGTVLPTENAGASDQVGTEETADAIKAGDGNRSDSRIKASDGIKTYAIPRSESSIEAERGPRVEGSAEHQPGAIAPLPLIKEKTIIYFSLNSNEIEPDSYGKLDQIAAYLVTKPQNFAYVRGYTDASGSSGYNETVSRFRASAVKSYLVGKGASADKIKVFAMGDAFPIAPNDTNEGRRLNRRVEIEFHNPSDAGQP